MLDDYRSTHRVVDEARIHETETDRIIRLKELELEEKKRERTQGTKVVLNRLVNRYGCSVFYPGSYGVC